jgi:hypothetical protein
MQDLAHRLRAALEKFEAGSTARCAYVEVMDDAGATTGVNEHVPTPLASESGARTGDTAM